MSSREVLTTKREVLDVIGCFLRGKGCATVDSRPPEEDEWMPLVAYGGVRGEHSRIVGHQKGRNRWFRLLFER